ncbi:YMC3 [Cyberlindnera jadinii]|uniref:Mitochondrial carrier protein n=1 Tax=Cyberlindnera jadinii (strain ATCC 18201 / CBS 1600 / BCRC 20928 / JCM 3617 / NBRC 0987 / NRRL Y-1542) TaxID=983966 RepID=A0A0H5C378_CYBJN|nr:mitochondrial carrier protein [Cyberlindnera jadinii NRRL Y-1542]ODV72868.1 mitochondrial carrier protein [Cyberlindnera jadinii NRRL Y-1542]CEP22117.1 YMC3 [Cyberlindnera jadinii]
MVVIDSSSDATQQTELSTKNSRLVGVGSAGIRALMYQLTTLYLRTPPAKLFRPTRVDYMAITRLFVNQDRDNGRSHGSSRRYNFYKDSSLGVLISAVRKFGWRFIPERVLPPLFANSATGFVLYTSYLTSLQHFNGQKTNFLENPSPIDTFRAGFVAGTFQSIAAAPIDAIYARSTANELLKGKHENLWRFGFEKLREVGFSGVFAGYGLSFIKESISFAIYFSTFETIKNQVYRYTRDSMISYYYYKEKVLKASFALTRDEYEAMLKEQGQFRFLKTSFVFIAGITASLALHLVQYPIAKIQTIHLQRLEAFDYFNSAKNSSSRRLMTVYYNSYIDTMEHVLFIQLNSRLSWKEWLYKGFKRHALSTIPSTTLGLVVLEALRTKLADEIGDTSFQS